MLTERDIAYIREQIAPHAAPVLSLYVDVNPAKPENANRAWLVRAKNALRALSLPADLSRNVLELLEQERPHARTLVLFAAEDVLERYDLQVDLPVVDLAHGRVEARWGEPYVAPLVYALDEFERAGALCLHRSGWRFFEIDLGEIQEITNLFAEIAQDEWGELEAYIPVLRDNLLRARATSRADRFAQRMQAWVYRFFKRLASIVERVVVQRDIRRLVLLGPAEETKFFEQFLSRDLRRRVVAHVGALPAPDASPSQVLERVAPALEAAERAEEQALLDKIRDLPGIWGIDPTLDALQMGQLSVLVAPWNLDVRVWRCPDGWVAETKERARLMCVDGEPEKVSLHDIIVDLAMDFGTRLEFVRGEAEERLRREFHGLAGLRRW